LLLLLQCEVQFVYDLRNAGKVDAQGPKILSETQYFPSCCNLHPMDLGFKLLHSGLCSLAKSLRALLHGKFGGLIGIVAKLRHSNEVLTAHRC